MSKCNSGSCPKSGIKIHNSDNDYKKDPFQIDLNIENYSVNDLYRLFSINVLDENTMKEAKKVVLKTHPDKSKLDPQYFLFFSAAYKRLHGIYEFQNKSTKKTVPANDAFINKENGKVLNNMLQGNKELQDPGNFNKWFNQQFEKHRIDDPNGHGYGDWLKSNEGIYDVGFVSKANMAQEFEQQKKQIQALTVYNGVQESFSSFSGSMLGQQSNYSGDNGSYTDLRQAYVESMIPVTEEDYKNIPKYRNVEEYKAGRGSVAPLDKETAMKKLMEQNSKDEQESSARAFYYAQQTERANKQSQSFWSGLKQLTNF
jgi:hypothetical protein